MIRDSESERTAQREIIRGVSVNLAVAELVDVAHRQAEALDGAESGAYTYIGRTENRRCVVAIGSLDAADAVHHGDGGRIEEHGERRGYGT